MNTEPPKISLIILTYNRAHLVEQAIDSVLRQTYRDFELIIVNNGSEDHTACLLKKYETHDQVRIFHLEKNRRFKGGINFAFGQIRGEWFSSIGDDDQLAPETFETMMRVLEEVDPSINAITCNAIDTATGQLSGHGLDRDQYLPIELIAAKARGNFWGITRTELLGDKRMNEKLPGHEDAFWYQIDAVANRYYIHTPLKIWCTDHGVTETATNRKPDISIRVQTYRELLNEPFYMDTLKKYNKEKYIGKCLRGLLFMQIAGEKTAVEKYRNMLAEARPGLSARLISELILTGRPRLIGQLYQAISKTKFA